MRSGCHIGEIHRTSRHPGRGSPLHELLAFTERCIFSINCPNHPPPHPALPCCPYSSSQVTWSMQNKGLLHYNFWLGNSLSNKIWKSIEKNLHSIKGRDIKKRKCWLSVVFQFGGQIPARGNCTWAAEWVCEGIAMPAAGWEFISCGRACICPRRPSPGWPPYWSSPRHSCCDTPEGEKKQQHSKGQTYLRFDSFII